MAKKKKHNNATIQAGSTIPQPSSTTNNEAFGRDSPAVPATSRGLSRGNTADLAKMFDPLLGMESEVMRNFPEQQKTVVGILKSMYGDQLTIDTTRKTVWGKQMLAFEVSLTAWNDVSISTRLGIELPPEYPKVAPIVRLVTVEPAVGDFALRLKQSVDHIIDVEQGDEMMVSSILQELEQLLNDFASEQVRRAQGASLEQERTTTEVAAHADASTKQRLALQQKQAEAAARDAKLAQDVQQQRRKQQQSSSAEMVAYGQSVDDEQYPSSCVIFNHDIDCHDSSTDTKLKFRAVQPMAVIYHRENTKVMLVCPYREHSIVTIQLVLKQLTIPFSLEVEAECRPVLMKIEGTLREAKTFDHQAVVKIHEYKLDQPNEGSTVQELFILSEYAQSSLTTLLNMVESINAVKIRTYTRSILDALEYYDRKGYIHQAVHAHNILLFGSEHSSYRAKLSDGYSTVLQAFIRRMPGDQAPDTKTGNWIAPELTVDIATRSNKTCIWELGVTMLQMALGADVMKTYTSPEDALYRAGLDPDFDHLISKMCAISARKRPTAFQLQSHHFFKSHTTSIFAVEANSKNSVPVPTRLKSVFESRWASEWEPVERLGKGGFGIVVKARNRLDGHFYAVKQLKCKSVRDTEEIWGEVRMLAQLNHPGIVRYFGAWSEDEHQSATDTDTSTAITDPRSFAPPSGSAAPRSSMFAGPSTGHDFMNPSLSQIPDVEEESNDGEEAADTSSDDDNPFGYQSPASDSENSQVVVTEDFEDEEPSDPFGLRPTDNIDDQPNFFDSNEMADQANGTHVPSKPEPFVAAGGTPSALRRPPQYYNRPSTLYIQMELCETGTLYDLIKNGLPDRIEEAWRLFRLILDGLEHIHALKVVHRDLKPMNIFIDAQKMPKIGDFGLASPSQASYDGHTIATHIAGPMSKGVGTLFYIAPELQDTRSTGKYSAKADMFALGVIFFEMCFPFKTSTERISWMQNINSHSNVLPARFNTEEYQVQGRIIRTLLSHDPDQRPSAKELLLDPEIPEPLEEEKEQRFIQRLMHGDPGQFERVMKNLLGKTATHAQSLAFAHTESNRSEALDEFLLDAIQQQLAEVFKMHGAVQQSRETVFPVESFYPNPVKYIDAGGFAVQLPYDLTVPFARSIAIRYPNYSRSFCFGTVYRQRQPGVEPLCIPEVDFDMVSNSARDLSLYDAQVISVLDDCLMKLSPLFSRSFTITISHGDLLDLIIRACEVPEAKHDSTKQVLSNLNVGKCTWKQVERDLLAPTVGLQMSSVNALSHFNFSCTLSETRQHVMSSLKKLKKDDAAIKATRTLNRLQEVNEYLLKLRVKTAVAFSPLANTSEMLYRGSILFKCTENKAAKTVAVGGRYDSLIRNYENPGQKTQARASGFRMNVMDLAFYAMKDAQIIANRQKAKVTIPPAIPPRIDVIVTSFDTNILRDSCVEIVRNLLDAGISTELTVPADSMEELEEMYMDVSKYWMVIVRSAGSSQRVIKVRSPDRDESDVTASELVGYLREEMGDRTASTHAEPVLRRSRSSHGASDRDNIVVLTPQHKSKKVNRAAIVDSTRAAAQELTEKMNKTFKVLAIDTDDSTLQKMRNTRLVDGETWKWLRHSVALTEREYIQEIQEQLLDWSKDGLQEGAFICNYKTKNCIYYDFGKL